MSKTSQQRTSSELPQQLAQQPSPRMETKKPTLRIGFWLLTGILVLVLIASVAAWQASKSNSSTKTVSQATRLTGGPAQVTHDMDHNLSVDTAQVTHDMDHNLSVDTAQVTHDMDHVLSPDP